MSIFEIPVGLASTFMVILIGYFVMTVWFAKPAPPVVQEHVADENKAA